MLQLPSKTSSHESIVVQPSEVDPDGEQFCYEVNRGGEARELPEQPMRVDLPHVAAVMEKLLASCG
jgi:hypothetical protein